MSDEPSLDGVADETTIEPVVDSSSAALDSTPEPADTSAVATPTEQPRNWWAEMPGLNDARDEQEARGRIAQLQQGAYRAQQQAQDYAHRLANSYRPQQQPAEPAKPAEPWYAKTWNPPALDRDELARWVVTNPETGQPDFKAGTPQAVQDKYHAWKSYQDKFQTEFTQNPVEWVYNGVKDKLLADAREVWQQEQAAQQNQQFQSHMADEVMGWAQARDANGQPIIVMDAQGVPRAALSPDGQFYQQSLQACLSQFPRHEWEARLPFAHSYAKGQMDVRYYSQQFAQQQAAPPVDPAVAAAAAKANYTKPRGGNSTSRGGRIAAAADPNTPSPSTSLADIIKEDMASKGLTLESVN